MHYISSASKTFTIMELKEIQEVYDRCNFSEEDRKVFPRPETEEDLEKFKKLIYQPLGFGGGFFTTLLLFLLLNGLFTPWSNEKYLEELLKADENKNPEQ